jgi:hypothetical protein
MYTLCYLRQSVCSLELSAAYFQSASSVFLSHKSANSIFSRLFSAKRTESTVENKRLKVLLADLCERKTLLAG